MNTRVNFQPKPRRGNRASKPRKHTLSKCKGTGLARFRDRHQARDGVKALSAGTKDYEVSSFACPECRGWHVEKNIVREPIAARGTTARAQAFTASLASRKRRYFLVDIENPTRGAKATCEQVAELWSVLKHQAPGVAPRDHVVVGASRNVARKYRAAIHGTNVKWVVGANAADAADRALLGAIDLHRVARDYDELVIISGDGAFSDLARRAKRAGLTVQVVTTEHPEQRSMLSRELAAAADVHTLVRLEARAPQNLVTPMPQVISPENRPAHLRTAAA